MKISSKLNELKPSDLNCNVFDVYNCDGLSMQELLCQFFTKINECVVLSNTTHELTNWLIDEGVDEKIALKITTCVNDGTFSSLLNSTLLGEINKKLENKANKDSVFTMENMGQDVKEAMTGGSVAVVGKNAILSENILDKQITSRKLADVYNSSSSNKVNTLKLTDGYLISTGPTGGSSYKTSDFIEVENGDVIRFYCDSGLGGNAVLRLYDLNKNYINQLDGNKDTTGTYKTATINNTDVRYIRFSFQTKNTDKAMLTINNDYPYNYVEFFDAGYIFDDKYKLNNSQKEQVIELIQNNTSALENVLSGKVITFNGDSICYGDGFSGGYGKIIADKYNMIYENKGVSGATITGGTTSSGGNRHCISRTINTMRVDADYIILEGGVNDSSLGVTLGDVTKSYTQTLDDTTFCGAFENMLKQAIDRFPGKKIGFIITHRMSESFETFYPKIIEICEKWGIPYCDLYTKCPSLNYIPYLKANYTKNSDGWHPNEAGYRDYYVPRIETWLKTL